MKIWIDADACPQPVKKIVFRASERVGVKVAMVANQGMAVPPSDWVETVCAPEGPDAADDIIAQGAEPGDIVVTADVPLAGRVVEKGALAITPRGRSFTPRNMGASLAVRDLMEQLRDQEVVRGGPPPFGPADKQRFASTLDAALARRKR